MSPNNSELFARQDGTEQDLLESLFPKVLANHVSKLEAFESVQYADILAMCTNPEESVDSRLTRVAEAAGDLSLRGQLVNEAGILSLVMTGREHEVSDAMRLEAYARSDQNQVAHRQSEKNLDYYIRNGIEIDFSPDDRQRAARYCSLDVRDVPLIEKLKAQRLFDINGFAESRVMYAVHDMIDHVWLFREMREAGIMDKYSDFLKSIDMEDGAFLYSRQAELFASVGFGSRRWKVATQQGEQPILDERKVQDVLRASEDDRVQAAASMLSSMDPAQRSQAVFMIENMAVQFADERRRWGAVKVSESDDQRRPINLFEPVHLAMMVESLDLLQRSKKFKAAQLSATVGVEAMLEEVIKDSSSESRIIVPVEFEQVAAPELNSDKLKWIRANLSVSTTYNRID